MKELDDGLTILEVLSEEDHPERSWQFHCVPVGHAGYAVMLIPEFFDKEFWIKDKGGLTIAQDFVSRFGREMENGNEIFWKLINWVSTNYTFPFIMCDTTEDASVRHISFAMECRMDELTRDEFEKEVERLVKLLYDFQEKEFEVFGG